MNCIIMKKPCKDMKMDHIHYNIIYEPWIDVIYLDGKKGSIGIRQAFQEAQQIREIEAPIFHGYRSYLNEMLIVRLLSNIIMAAFMSKDHEAMRDSYILKLITDSKSLYENDYISQYLADYESRFDIFDDKHPFMQDVTLKDNKKMSDNYQVVLSTYSPGDSTKIFGKARSGYEIVEGKIKAGYRIHLKELVYALISNSSVAGKPSTKQYSSIMNKAFLFTVLKGKDLKETILLNCIPLTNSSNKDKPIWEFDRIEDIYDYSGKDVLACEYFPSKALYIYPELDENGCICKAITTSTAEGESRGEKEEVLPPHIENEYIIYNPFTIKDQVEEKAKDEKYLHSYKQYNNTNDAWLLSIAATNAETEKCTIIENWKNISYKLKKRGFDIKVKLDIFYRELDSYNNLVKNDGKITISDIAWLLTEEGHKLAETYEDDYEQVRTALKKAVSTRIHNTSICENIANTASISLSGFAEHYFYEHLYKEDMDIDELREKAFLALKEEAINIFNQIQAKADPISYTNGYIQLYYLSKKEKKIRSE